MMATIRVLNAPPCAVELAFYATLGTAGLHHGHKWNRDGADSRIEEVRSRRNRSGCPFLAVHHACCAVGEKLDGLCCSLFEPLNYGPLATARRVGSDFLHKRMFGALAALAALDLALAERLRDEYGDCVRDRWDADAREVRRVALSRPAQTPCRYRRADSRRRY
ncbi:hypothetical protein [Burkholderia sp. SRS-W-2-2016]|uniref:hypothetical protein n=1 Tax=Burkholderia sp. SRS-W-2-2016 TaxID=1926878 RepID=UPI00117E1891|nr:hypothetical protein [Burkholderia sp. SRS-W-2-2016]